MRVENLFLYCPGCERESLTEAPPCLDGHGDSCPDRACVECGSALSVDALLVQLIEFAGRGRSHSRRAA